VRRHPALHGRNIKNRRCGRVVLVHFGDLWPICELSGAAIILHQRKNLLKPRGSIAGLEEFLPLGDLDRHQRRDHVGGESWQSDPAVVKVK
jgi:hypothetical protein